MANTLYARLYYQAREEVLETGVWYVDLSPAPAINVQDHIDFCDEMAADVAANWSTWAGTGATAWAAEVSVPIQEDDTNGPYRFNRHIGFVSAFGEPMMPDLAVVRAKMSGTSSNNEPVSGGLRMSGLPDIAVDCNVISQQIINNFETFVDAVWPPIRSTTGGANFTRVIKHQKTGFPVEFVPAPTTVIPARITTRDDRVLNKTPYKISPATP